MKTIYKYPVTKNQKLPVGFKVLRVGQQNGCPFIWCEVVPDSYKQSVDFEMFGTGDEIPESAKHIGSFSDGPFEWHLYQVEREGD